jgi:hypothetical protein
MEPGACNYNPLAVEEDGSCEYASCRGCMDATACNFNSAALIPAPDQCEYFSCSGCMDPAACNYDATATLNAFNCIYAVPLRDCAGNCYIDSDGDGACDGEEVYGCTYPAADNYNPSATQENGTCTFFGLGGVEVYGCTYPTACNYDAFATVDNGTCIFADWGYTCSGVCLFDTDGDGVCDDFEGCPNPAACNYSPAAQDNDGSCVFPPTAYTCSGSCVLDTDGDGICNPFEVPGCTSPGACNFNPFATDNNGTCVFPGTGYTCAGQCIADLDGDGVCDVNEVEGCTHSLACNFNPNATENDGSCWFPALHYTCAGACIADGDGDGICDPLELAGCTYLGADNYNPLATDDNGSCVFSGNPIPGCIYPTACNYQPAATADNGSCVFPAYGYTCAGTCIVDTDGDGVCDVYEVIGCMDPEACNYDVEATDAGPCNYLMPGMYCDGTCYNDANGDGVCDVLPGCTNPVATNYNPAATQDDGSCVFACASCVPVFSPAVTNSTVGCLSDLPAVPPVRIAINPCTGDTLEVVSMLIASSNNPCTGFRRFRHLALNDACGNFTAVVEQISVAETSPPVLVSVPTGLVLACDAAPAYGVAVFSDACTPFTVAYTEQVIPGSCPSTYSIVRTAQATDLCGNVGTGSYVIHIVDSVAPVWNTFPLDVSLACGEAVPTLLPGVSDACSVWTLSEGQTTAPGACPGSTLVYREFTAADACGNSAHRTQTVTFVDAVPPAFISIPADITIACTAPVPEDVATASDACGPVSVAYSDVWEQGICAQEGIIHRTHVATDGCGNAVSFEQLIAVEDTTPPAMHGPSLVQSGCAGWQEPMLFASDACGSTTLVFSSTPVQATAAPGSAVRVYTATDACGNETTGVQLVTFSESECGGCTSPFALNFDPNAVYDDGSCIAGNTASCMGDLNEDGVVSTADLLLLLAAFETVCTP